MSNLPDLNDAWYAGDNDNGYAYETTEYDAQPAANSSSTSQASRTASKPSSSKFGEVDTDLFYDSQILPPFLVKRASISTSTSSFLSGGLAAGAKLDEARTATMTREQDIRLPVKDPMSRLASLAKEGSEALRLFRREEQQRKANIEATDTTHSTVNTLLRQHARDKGASMTEEEYDKIQRQARMERLRNATPEERAAIEAEERLAEAKAAKEQGSMKDIDKIGGGGGWAAEGFASETEYYSHLRTKLAPARKRLPVYKCREALLDYISQNQVCVIEGETGSGKTTQLVQYLYEAGYTRDGGIIGCTQPRKVAAVGVSKRVADEVGCPLGSTVGYAIRLDNRSGPDTKIKFMTEGIMLREVIHDPDVSKYSVIVLDEAHERSIDTDVLLGVLKGVVRRRSDLKVIVTSATMNTARFCEFFYDAKVFKIPGKVFPVDVVYEPPLSLGKADYIEDTVAKILELHLDRWNLLAGIGGDKQQPTPALIGDKRPREEEDGEVPAADGEGDTTTSTPQQPQMSEDDTIKAALAQLFGDELDEDRAMDANEESSGLDILVFLPGKEEIITVIEMVKAKLAERPRRFLDSLLLVPLYSELPPAQQLKALEPTPKGMRKCVVSTNVAETSLTIDGIRFVVDAGFMRTNVYRPAIGMNSLQTYPISQAEANQRKGRAGRTARGVCYRLYSEEQFENEMLVSPVPEIQRSSIDSVVLLLKSIGVDNIMDFDFIDTPPEATIRDSCYKLWLLAALNGDGKVTKEGLRMLEFPVEPSLAKMLLISTREEYRCCEEMLSIAAMISAETRTLYLNPQGKEDVARQERSKFNVSNSDHLTLLNIFLQFVRSGKSKSWCRDNYLDYRTLARAVDIRSQFVEKMRATRLPISPPCRSVDEVSERLREVLVFGHISQVAKRVKWNEYESLQSAVTCAVSPSSAIVEAGGASMPDYCVYHEFRQTSREYMVLVTEVLAAWVVKASRGVIRERGTAYDPKAFTDPFLEEEEEAAQKQQQQKGSYHHQRNANGAHHSTKGSNNNTPSTSSVSNATPQPPTNTVPQQQQRQQPLTASQSLAQSLREAASHSSTLGVGGASLFAAPPAASSFQEQSSTATATASSIMMAPLAPSFNISVDNTRANSVVAGGTQHGSSSSAASSVGYAATTAATTVSAATSAAAPPPQPKPSAPKMSPLELQKLKMMKAKKTIL